VDDSSVSEAGYVIPMIAMPARFAFAIVSSRSRRIPRPASNARTDAFTDSITSMVRGPTAGRSNRRSCWGFAPFHHHGAAMRQFTAPADRAIGSFHGFDGHNHPILHHDALADIQRSDLFSDIPAVPNVFPFLFTRLAPRQRAFLDQDPFQAECRLADLNAFLFDLFGHPAEDVVVLEMNQFRGQSQGAKVRADRGKICASS
jgi:hypothetical protein